MEAPEKIYLQKNTTTDCYEEWWPEWFEARNKECDIEYTRTDAFIEKACNLLVDCIEDFMFRRMEIWGEESKKKTLENLRKAMKGE